MAGEQDAWAALRGGILAKWGYEGPFHRIESPLTAPGFPDVVAFREGKRGQVSFIELKAWYAGSKEFSEHDVPWRPGQRIVLSQIARLGGHAVVCCRVKRALRSKYDWWWGVVDGRGEITWSQRNAD